MNSLEVDANVDRNGSEMVVQKIVYFVHDCRSDIWLWAQQWMLPVNRVDNGRTVVALRYEQRYNVIVRIRNVSYTVQNRS